MDRQELMTRIHAHGRFTGAPGLHRIRALMDALGNPQNSLKFVHVAGTNGKGSTSCMIASALEQAGYQTGLFVSPFVLDFRERIQINKTWISEWELAELSEQVFAAEEQIVLPAGECIGEFEFTTAVAFLYFARHACDIVVLEVGLGGRYDATNIIEAPEVCVMTHIDLDHTAVLGDTVSEIASDKCHIVKNGTTLVCAPRQPEDAVEVLRERCAAVGAAFVPARLPTECSCSFTGGSCVIDGTEIDVKMVGEHQLMNASSAYSALRQMQLRGWKLSEQEIQNGLRTAIMPARQEIVSDFPLIMVDGGHNLDGVSALCSTLDTMLPPGGISIVLGMVDDKQYEQCIHMLVRRADNVYACQPDTPRAVPSETITKIVREFSPYTNAFDCGDVASALKRAMRYAGEDDVIIVCGSLYVASEAEKVLRPDTF